MALARWSPFSEMGRLRDEMDRLFERFLPGEAEGNLPATMTLTSWAPTVDVYEKDGCVMVDAELPGVKKEDVDVSVEENTITIRGEMKREEEKKEEGFFRRERHYGRFVRSIPLPVDVKADQAKASFKEGVLHISLPKSQEEHKGNKIQIE